MSQRESRGGRGGGGRGRGRGGGGQDRDRRERDDGRRGGTELSHSPLPRRTKTHDVSVGDSRARSRSPRRDGPRDTRTRSPPRGPRRENDRDERPRERERDERPRNPTKPQLARPAPKPSEKPADKSTNGATTKMETDADEAKPVKEEDEDSDEAAMRKVMGFGKFRSTKNTKVPGNDKNYAVRKEKKTEYRQYMNRTGGFNRPLSPG
jgi:U4/U6.U5 tri-snRNP-associated protein 3